MQFNATNRSGIALASVLLVTVLVSGAAIMVTATANRSHTVELAENVVPASLLLLNLDRDAYQAELFLERVVSREAAGLDANADRLGHAENHRQLYGERWTRFRAIGAELESWLPGEAEVAAQYVEDRREWSTTADQIIALEPGPERDAALETGKAQFAAMRHHLDVLEEEYYEPRIGVLGSSTVRDITVALIVVIVSMVVVVGVTVTLTVTNIVALRRQARAHASREGELLEDTERQTFETQLRRALEMSTHEDAALKVLHRATEHALDGAEMTEFLTSNSSRTNMRSAFRESLDDAPGCAVRTPDECRAIVTGSTQVFADSRALDTCPYLSDRDGMARTAVCVPVSINGRAAGTLHATRPCHGQFDGRDQARLSAIANYAGIQLSVLRNSEIAAHQATTDPLTGLANRRSIETTVHHMRETRDIIAVLMIDIDHFKDLNDTYGHETGDRALRLFADAARDITVDDDTAVGRWGGEEFVIVRAGASAADGAGLAERLRKALAIRLLNASTPTFTVSVGVSSMRTSRPFHTVLESADKALYDAKEAGRDSVMIARDSEGAPPSLDRVHGESAVGESN